MIDEPGIGRLLLHRALEKWQRLGRLTSEVCHPAEGVEDFGPSGGRGVSFCRERPRLTHVAEAFGLYLGELCQREGVVGAQLERALAVLSSVTEKPERGRDASG